MHHRTDHNNINNNDTIDTDREQNGMNSSGKYYIKNTGNCTRNNPWSTDAMDDNMHEGINRNGDESTNHLRSAPIKAPEWIIYLTGMNKNDMRIIFLWLLLDPPSPFDSEETAIRSLMDDAKYFHGDDDLHDRLELIISRFQTVEDITTTVTNWKEEQIPRHIHCMCGTCLSNQAYVDCINSIVETNWNNDPFIEVRTMNRVVKLGTVAMTNMINSWPDCSGPEEFLNEVRMMNKMIKTGIVEIVGDDHVENSEPEEFVPSSELEEYTTYDHVENSEPEEYVPSSELEEYATSPIPTPPSSKKAHKYSKKVRIYAHKYSKKVRKYSKKALQSTLPHISELEEYKTSSISTQHTLHNSNQTNDNNELVMISSRNGGHTHATLNDTNNGETAGYDPETIAMIDQWMMLEMAHEEMVEEIGIPRTARLMALLRCYKRRRKSTIILKLEQLRLGTSIYDESRKRVWVKVETTRLMYGEWHRPLDGITRVASKCNQRRMISSLAEIGNC